MSYAINSLLSESALKILRPLVRVLIRNGVSSGSLEELVRKAFVDEAFSMGQTNGKKTTVSSVSAQTGLSRKEVKRLSELSDVHNTDVEGKYNRAVRVISGWSNDKTFSNSLTSGLPMEGDSASFATLVKQYSGDIPTKAMLDLLVAADCVRVADNKVMLIKHAYVPGKDSAEIISILGTDTNELMSTIDYNLTTNDGSKRYQRKVSCVALKHEKVEEFIKLSSQQSQSLLENLDAWLSQHEADPDDNDTSYVSLGIYYYEHESLGVPQ